MKPEKTLNKIEIQRNLRAIAFELDIFYQNQLNKILDLYEEIEKGIEK